MQLWNLTLLAARLINSISYVLNEGTFLPIPENLVVNEVFVETLSRMVLLLPVYFSCFIEF